MMEATMWLEVGSGACVSQTNEVIPPHDAQFLEVGYDHYQLSSEPFVKRCWKKREGHAFFFSL